MHLPGAAMGRPGSMMSTSSSAGSRLSSGSVASVKAG